MRTTSPDMPKEVVKGNHLGQPQYTITFNVVAHSAIDPKDVLEQGPDFQLPEFTYEYNSVTLPPGKFDYDTIVSALVNEIYPSDRMQAVVNNYLASPDDEEIKAEFEEMQAWRAEAKATAKRLLAEKK